MISSCFVSQLKFCEVQAAAKQSDKKLNSGSLLIKFNETELLCKLQPGQYESERDRKLCSHGINRLRLVFDCKPHCL